MGFKFSQQLVRLLKLKNFFVKIVGFVLHFVLFPLYLGQERGFKYASRSLLAPLMTLIYH